MESKPETKAPAPNQAELDSLRKTLCAVYEENLKLKATVASFEEERSAFRKNRADLHKIIEKGERKIELYKLRNSELFNDMTFYRGVCDTLKGVVDDEHGILPSF